MYAIKSGLDGQIDNLKASLVAKGYTQIYGPNYGDTFSRVANITSVCLFLVMAAIRHWPSYHLDIKNEFLHCELEKNFIWCNCLNLLLRGSLDWFPNYDVISMGLNSPHVGFESLIMLPKTFCLNEVDQIIQSSIVIPLLRNVFTWWFMWTI